MDEKNVKITSYEKIEDRQKNKIKSYINDNIKISTNIRLHQNEIISSNEKKNKLYNSNSINKIQSNINVENDKNSLSNKIIDFTQNKKVLENLSKDEYNDKNDTKKKNTKCNIIMKNKNNLINDYSNSNKKVDYSKNNKKCLLYKENKNIEKYNCDSEKGNIIPSNDLITYKNDLNLNHKRKIDTEGKLSNKTNIHKCKFKKYDFINSNSYNNSNTIIKFREMSNINNKNVKHNNNGFYEKKGIMQDNLDKGSLEEMNKEIPSLSNKSTFTDKKSEEKLQPNDLKSNMEYLNNNDTYNQNKNKGAESKYTDNSLQNYSDTKSNNLKYIKKVYNYDDEKYIKNKSIGNNIIPSTIHQRNDEKTKLNKNFLNEEKWIFKNKINVNDNYLKNKNKYKKSNELNDELFNEDTLNDSVNFIQNINNENNSHTENNYIQEFEVNGNKNEVLKKNNKNREINCSSFDFSNSIKGNYNYQGNHYINNVINQNNKISIDNLNNENSINDNIKSKEQFNKESLHQKTIIDEEITCDKIPGNVLGNFNSNYLTEKNYFKEINGKKEKFSKCFKQENDNDSTSIENSYKMNEQFVKRSLNTNEEKGSIDIYDLNYRNNKNNSKEIYENIDNYTNNNIKMHSEIDYDNSTIEKVNDTSNYNLNSDKYNKCFSVGNTENFHNSKSILNISNDYKNCNYNEINITKNEDKNELSKMTSKNENINWNTNTENIYKEKKNCRHINLFNEIQNKYKKKLIEENLNLIKNENIENDVQNMDICSNKEIITMDNEDIQVFEVEKKDNDNVIIENEKGLLKKEAILNKNKNCNLKSANNFCDKNNKRKVLVNKYKKFSSIISSKSNLFFNKKVSSELKTIKKNFKENNKIKTLSKNENNSFTRSNTYASEMSGSKLRNNKNDKYMYSINNDKKKNDNSSSIIRNYYKKINNTTIISSSNSNNVLGKDKYKSYNNLIVNNYPKNLNMNKNIDICGKKNLSNLIFTKNKNIDFTLGEKEQRNINNCEKNNKIIKIENKIINKDRVNEEIKNEHINDNVVINKEIKKEHIDDNKVINKEIRSENLDDNKVINKEIRSEYLDDNSLSNEKVKNEDNINNEQTKNGKRGNISICKKIENNSIKKKITENEKISSSISSNSSKYLKSNLNLKSGDTINSKNTKLSNNMVRYKTKKNINENNNNLINKKNENISDNIELSENKKIIYTTSNSNSSKVIRNKYKTNMYNNKESYIKKLNVINREKGNYIEQKKKNIYDYNSNKYINNNNFKDIINEEMEKYKSSNKYKLKSNSIPPNTQRKNKNNNILIKNGKQMDCINKKEKTSKNIVLKKQSNSCDDNNKSLKKIKRDNSEKKNSNNSSNNEKKEISYFEWLAKEKKKKEEEVDRKNKSKINDTLNDEEENLMLQPLSAFNLRQNQKIYEQDDFIVDKHPIGNGRTGLVFKAIIKKENEKVALKVMAKDTILTLNIERQVLKEIIIQASLKHINILELIAYFEDKTRLFLILELANGGSVRNKMKLKSQPLKEEEVALYVYQIADALSYLHNFNIIHRDLKPDNILIHYSDQYLDNKIYKYGIIKLADFGFSCQLKNKRQKRSTFCGTVDYMPPEIINQMPYDCNVDLWCLGIVIFELLVGFPPFTDDTQERIFNQIKELNFHFPKTVSLSAQELILKLCSRTAEERISAEEVKSHPWIKQFLQDNENVLKI
ncbi:serine/threonine protein kinase, putative [Plasmodium gallinaceum]|uniref:Aurora kinase n=1 Tax=Plasmodium gallinaceum TaxID=5849 RepID=A0A1J1GS63_PLAGA|nr:serine/threonine protein kinase, putative [Plasmodium gallinaceum]CRG95319.1 serine/threonine protein kinase, putative [Plasmodium gallinaceum]